MSKKVPFSPDKRAWHPSPLLGQIVLVTTLNEDSTSNVAPKSWITMVAMDPPILAVGCNLKHWTARNALARREFVVNVPGAELVQVIWDCSALPHPRPVEAIGLTPLPGLAVQPPRIQECKAHLECVLDQHIAYGDEVLLLGRIVAASIDEAATEAADAYKYLRIVVFLEDGTYGVVEEGRRLNESAIER